MTVEITQLTSEELRIMRTAFNIFDRNADNQIDQAEFGTLIRAIGFNASNHEIDEIPSIKGTLMRERLVEFLVLESENVMPHGK